MNRIGVVGSTFLFLSSLMIMGCQKSATPANISTEGSNVPYTPTYGQGTFPPDTSNPKGPDGTSPSTSMIGGSTTPSGAVPTTQGQAPLSIGPGYAFPNLLQNLLGHVGPFDPHSLPDASFLNVLYCEAAKQLNRSGTTFADSYDYVEALYLDLLGRLPEAAGFEYWVNRLGNVYNQPSRLDVSTGIITSDESYRRIVRLSYLTYLLRFPAENGSYFEGQGWVDWMKQGARVEDVHAGFLGSYEYLMNRAQHDAGNLIRMYYRQVLGREVESQDALNYWVGQLNAQGGLDNENARRWVAVHIIDSDEGRLKQIEMVYLRLLGRFPDPAGHQYWLGRMQSDLNNLTMTANIASSDEYLNRQPGRLRPWSQDAFCQSLNQ